MSACSLPGGCPDLTKVRLSDGSDGSIGQACFPSDKKLSDGEKMTSSQARLIIQLGMSTCSLPGGCPDLTKVRLSDGSDGSIGQACFPSDKKLSDGEKRRHHKLGLIIQLAMSACCLPGDCPDLVKVR